jgi:hypothetical protein
MDRITLVLAQYTSQILEGMQDELRKVVWTSGESNLEEGYASLAAKCCLDAWKRIQIEFPEYVNTSLVVKLPDLTLVFINNAKEINGKIELKNSWGKKVNGSTIGKLDINQASIYCKKPIQINGKFEFRYGQYHSGMIKTPLDLFQDRTPRPDFDYTKLEDPSVTINYIKKEKEAWIPHYAECAIRRVQKNLNSWQDTLTSAIIDYFLKTTTIEQIIERRSKLLESAEPSSQLDSPAKEAPHSQ